jgi:hypothetical protein
LSLSALGVEFGCTSAWLLLYFAHSASRDARSRDRTKGSLLDPHPITSWHSVVLFVHPCPRRTCFLAAVRDGTNAFSTPCSMQWYLSLTFLSAKDKPWTSDPGDEQALHGQTEEGYRIEVLCIQRLPCARVGRGICKNRAMHAKLRDRVLARDLGYVFFMIRRLRHVGFTCQSSGGGSPFSS